MRKNLLIAFLVLCLPLGFFCPAISGGSESKASKTRPPATVVEPDVISAACHVDGCSGTAIEFGGRAWVVTAAHCFELGQKVYVVTGDKLRSGVGMVVAMDFRVDLALVAVERETLTSTVAVPLKLPAGPWYGVGYPDGEGPQAWFGEFLGIQRISNLPRGRWAWKLKKGRFEHGSSGSGVFKGGKLVAVATHSNDKTREIFAAPLHDLQAFLARVGKELPRLREASLAGLVEEDTAPHHTTTEIQPAGDTPASWGDRDRTREILAIKEQLKTLAGKPGPPGPPGPAGNTGPGMDQAKLEEILRRLESLETWTRDFRATVRIKVHPKESTR